jgi:YidC/Oxa1 family membrane protein insertase
MAEPADGKTPQKLNLAGDNQDTGMQKRLLLAFGLMGLVLLGSQFLFKPSPPPGPPKAAEPKAAAAPANAPTEAKPVAPAAAPAKGVATAPKVPLTAASAEEHPVIDTDYYHVEFTNRGAKVKSWFLKRFKDSDGKPIELVDPAAEAKAGLPFGYSFHGAKPGADLNGALFTVKRAGPYEVQFEYSDGTIAADKRFSFDKRSYRVGLESDVTVNSQSLPHMLTWRGGFGDRSAYNAVATMHSVYYDAVRSKLVLKDSKAGKDGPVTEAGAFVFAGLEDTYFAAVILPEPGVVLDFQTWSDTFSPAKGADEVPHVGVAYGTQGPLRATLFVGPKDIDILRAVNPKLELIIDWGWFGLIAKPFFLVLHWFNDNLTGNWGWAIVVLTVILNFLMLPLRFSSMRSSQKMAKLQPKIQAINAKFKGVSMKDPRKQQQNQELMELYRKEGINPLGGCVPLILQMPFFFAFFKVLSVAIDLRGAPWLWIHDLSQPEPGLIRFLPILMLITQIAMQKMTPAAGGDPSQQRMMMLMMPIMLTFFFYNASAGLVLYWLTGNVVGILQQYVFNRTAPVPVPVQAETPKKKKK